TRGVPAGSETSRRRGWRRRRVVQFEAAAEEPAGQVGVREDRSGTIRDLEVQSAGRDDEPGRERILDADVVGPVGAAADALQDDREADQVAGIDSRQFTVDRLRRQAARGNGAGERRGAARGAEDDARGADSAGTEDPTRVVGGDDALADPQEGLEERD